MGAVFGLSGELLIDNSNGQPLVFSIISAVALRAIGYYLGAGAAAGIFLGTITGLLLTNPSYHVEKTAVAGALFGGALGYLVELAGPFTHVVVVL